MFFADVPARIIHDKFMIPPRKMAEFIGAAVDRDDDMKCVFITTQ